MAKKYPGEVIFLSDNFKNNYLLLPQILSSDMHQSQYFDGCQEIESSSFIFVFWALRFW